MGWQQSSGWRTHGWRGAAAAAATPFAIDGTAGISSLPGPSSVACTLSTTYANDLIIMVVAIVSGTTTVSSVSNTSGLTWAKKGSFFDGSNHDIEVWWAKSPSALSSDTITATFTGSAAQQNALAFGVSGVNFTTPFDTDVSNPNTGAGARTISTSAANTIVFGAFNSGATTATGSWATVVANSGFLFCEYQAFSATQSSLSVPEPSGGSGDAAVAFAVQSA